MSFGEAVQSALGNYAKFTGRALRSEYWYFVLFTIIVSFVTSFVLTLVIGELAGSLVNLVVTLALLIPSISVATRRLHDVGRSGWWQLLSLTIIGIIPLLIWLASEGTPGTNAYGPPAAKAQANVFQSA